MKRWLRKLLWWSAAGDAETWTGEQAHDPRCYQSRGVPADLPQDLCDCKIYRMFDEHRRNHGC